MTEIFTERSFDPVQIGSDNIINVNLGWNEKEGSVLDSLKGKVEESIFGYSDKSYDLNLAAILIHDGDAKPELIKHSGIRGQSTDKSKSVHLSADNRTGSSAGTNESIKIEMAKLPKTLQRIILFVNITGGKQANQNLGEVNNVFVQIQGEKLERVFMRVDSEFETPEASEACTYCFAEIVKEDNIFELRAMSRYSDEDSEEDTFENLLSDRVRMNLKKH